MAAEISAEVWSCAPAERVGQSHAHGVDGSEPHDVGGHAGPGHLRTRAATSVYRAALLTA